MTTIAAFSESGIVYMAGDKGYMIYEDVTQECDLPKAYAKDGGILIGASGAGVCSDAVSQWEPPELIGSVADEVSFRAYLHKRIIPSLWTQLQEYGATHEKEGRKLIDGCLILGIAGRVVLLSARGEPAVPSLGYGVIGSGNETALGAFHALQGLDMDPMVRISRVMAAAAAHDVYTHSRWDVVSA